MNAQAVAVERALGRPVLQSLHAAFSLATIVGAATGGAAIWAHVSPLGYLSAVAGAGVLVSAGAARWLLPAAADRERPGAADASAGPEPGQPRRGTGWSPFVLVLGLLGAGCLLAEGAAQSWAAVFLRDQRHAAPALASAAYLVFTAMQLVGRLPGDRLHRRLGSARLVRLGAVTGAAGLALELVPSRLPVAIAGIAIYGLGLSVLVPVVFGAVGHGSAAARGEASVTEAVARFTTLSYLGYLLGPASIGWLAEATGLTWALAAVSVVLAAMFGFASWTAGALPETTARPETAARPEAAT